MIDFINADDKENIDVDFRKTESQDPLISIIQSRIL